MRTANFDTTLQWIMPVVIAIIFILLCSLIKEPARKKIMAILIAGAGAAYLSGGGFGLWEMAFCTVLAVFSFKSLRSYTFICIGLLFYSASDILHPTFCKSPLPFALTSF